MPTATCIFEFKLDQSAPIAFDQAELKQYKERFADANKNILVIGLNFSSTSRNISEWKSQLFSPDGKKLNAEDL